MLQTIEISKQVKVLVDLAKKTNMEPSVLIGLIIAEFGQDAIDVDIPSSVFGKDDEEKEETVVEETEPIEVQIDVEKPKQPIGSVKIAHQIAEKNGKGFSYFGKFFCNKREFQKKLHLTGEIKRYVLQEMEKGRTLEESVEEWCHDNIFDILTVTFKNRSYNMSSYIKKAGIAAGYVRAEKLDSPSISWEKAIKRVLSKMRLEAPKKEEIEDIKTEAMSYTMNYDPKNIQKKPGNKKIPTEYHGEHFESRSDFYAKYHISGVTNGKILAYAGSGLFKGLGDAFDHFLDVEFSKYKNIPFNGMEFEDLTELLDFYKVDYCDFWVYIKENRVYPTYIQQGSAIESFASAYPNKFKRAISIKQVHKILQKPVDYNGKHYVNGMDLLREYCSSISQAIGTMADRGLSPEELIEYHVDEDGTVIEAKDVRLNQKKKEPHEYKGADRVAHQSYTKIGIKPKNIPVTYNGKEYRSIQDGCDQLGIAQDCKNVRNRMKKGMSFEEAVDDVLMNKSNRGRKRKEEDPFIYESVKYNTLFDACKVYDVKESSVRNYAKDYGVKLHLAFGVIVGDIDEKDLGIDKKKAYVTK